MQLIDGKQIAAEINAQTKQTVEALSSKPKLAILVAGDDPASGTFVNMKDKKATEVGIETEVFRFGSEVTVEEIIDQINKLNIDDTVTGILVQLPVFTHLKSSVLEILNAIDPKKDVDVLTAVNQGRWQQGLPSTPPATVEAILECLQFVAGSKQELAGYLKGKNVVVVNHSNLIGKPLADALLNMNATVTVCHEFTGDLKNFAVNADIVISAAGKPGLLDHTFFKQGAVAIDCTSLKVGEGFQGDIAVSPELDSKLSYLTPVPGGIGPITVACLLRNLITIY